MIKIETDNDEQIQHNETDGALLLMTLMSSLFLQKTSSNSIVFFPLKSNSQFLSMWLKSNGNITILMIGVG